MGRYLFRLPDVGEGVAEAEIVLWHIKPGDRIAEDQSLVDVMTDKATVEMTSPVAGVVTACHGEIGALMSVGSVLVEMDVEGGADDAAENAETGAEAPPAAPAPKKAPPPEPPRPNPEKPAAPRQVVSRPAGVLPLASPAVRRRAYELGIALQFVPGTGPEGRITFEDLEDFVASGGAGATASGGPVPKTGVTETKIVGLRRKIAEKMQESKRRIPHFTYIEEFDMTELEALRADLNANRKEGQPKLTLLPFFMRALVRLLPEFPNVNARYDDEAGILQGFEAAHIGIATQTPKGLLVPVVRHAETLDIWESAREIARVTAAARDGTASREALSGSTITLTSLGALGGISATPVINHPEVAIIGPNKLVERPVVQGGQVVVRKMMNLSSSFDHRIIDGYDAAQFIQRIKRLIEHPALLFMDDK